MNGVSIGAVSGARAAYDIHNPSNNQENQGPRKASNVGVQPRSTSNPRAPLSDLPADRVEHNEYGQPPQQRTYDRVEGMVSGKGKAKQRLDVENQQSLHKNHVSNGNLSHTGSDDIPENMYRPEKEEAEGWIHREKLAKIENEELQAAGINLAKARSKNKDALGDRLRTSSRDRLRNDYNTGDRNGREENRRKVSSPVPAQPEDQDDATVERANWDLRTPEEIAADQGAYTTPVLRKSGSKIPILSPSSNPASPDSSERDTPLPRKRTMSGTISNDDDLYAPKVRTGSSKWNEDALDSTPAPSSKTNSPTKVKQKSVSAGHGPSSTAKGAVPRKASISKTNTASSNGRPRTRGTDSERPRTAVNPPEGDPPWLADMYKPDPRLPPDQQLIPTLAKKQRQMQWEESGMIPKTYDREFAPLAVHENGNSTNYQQTDPGLQRVKSEDTESWPLKPIPGTHLNKEPNTKPNGTISSPTTTGGYSTMPKVSSPPIGMTSPKIGAPANPTTGAPSPNIGPSRQSSATQQPSQKARPRPLSDDEDEKAQKKGCACCVVM